MLRRSFLQGAAAAGLGSALLARRAFGSGDLPEQVLPSSARAFNVLECFLYGGLSTWESFYGVPEYGRPDDPDPALRNTQLYTFDKPGGSPLVDALKKCGLSSVDLLPFAQDALGKTVHLGPIAAPLLARKDLLDRLRIVVTRHDLEPHEAAIPLALCGRTLGAPSMASLGAHVARHFTGSEADRRSPYTYTFATSYIPSDNVLASVATGLLPGSSRPLLIKVDGIAQLSATLERKGVGSLPERERHDALLEQYISQQKKRISRKDVLLRAPRLGELEQAARSVKNVDGVKEVLDPALFTPISSTVCGDSSTNLPAMSLRLATHLLTHPKEPARYCCVIDGGLLPADGGGGYDTHAENPYTQTRNFHNFLGALLPMINEPGEKDPKKINLDRTMIVLSMEFGRSPGAQGELGRNHWPYGYVTMYLGGPARRGIYGAIGPDGRATTFTTPAENRMAAMLALGIWPFFPDSFGVSDVQGVAGELEGAQSVVARLLGVTS
ncbi:MAG: DUF1501 domain-containing protein [Myxococcales bacterium]|nr:DUF1501 domain-containing protein [Polyangiaceae bacterium]MDW8251203.1 DUF1501 domain-containing protein [Myxococcales bacterium]